MKGTNIAKVEVGDSLAIDPTVQFQNPDDNPKAHAPFPYIVPSPSSMRDHCDIIFVMSRLSALLFQWENHCPCAEEMSNLSAHLPALLLKFAITIAIHKPIIFSLSPILCL